MEVLWLFIALFGKKLGSGANKMSQRIKVPAAKLDNRSSIPGMYMVERESRLLPSCLLTSTCTRTHERKKVLKTENKKTEFTIMIIPH